MLAVEIGKSGVMALGHSFVYLLGNGLRVLSLEGSIDGVYDILRRLWLLEGMMGEWGN